MAYLVVLVGTNAAFFLACMGVRGERRVGSGDRGPCDGREIHCVYCKNVSTPGDGLGEGARLPTLRISVAEHPLPELLRVDDILDADVTRGPSAGLLIAFSV